MTAALRETREHDPARHPSRQSCFDLELRHLAALAAIGDERSFSTAAARLGYAQSAVSQQVLCLERLLGARLVDRTRTPKPVSLTEAGELLLTHTNEILAHLQQALGDLDGYARDRDVTLTLGVTPESVARVVPTVIGRLHSRHPQISVTVHELSSDADLFARLRAHELDAVVADVASGAAEFARQPVARDQCVLLTPEDRPVSQCARERLLAELVTTPLIGRRGCASVAALVERLRAEGFEPHSILRTDVHATLPALVTAGVGFAVMPRLAVDPAWRGLTVVGLEELVEPRELALFWNADAQALPSLAAVRAETRGLCA